jgi:hypothetical protein
MNISKVLLYFLLALASAYAQNTIGFDVNDKDVEVLGSASLNTFDEDLDGGLGYQFNASYLYADGDSLGSVGFGAQSSFAGLEGLAFGLGAKLVATDNFSAIPLYGKIIYSLPLDSTIPTISLATTFAYSPEVLSFNDAKHYTELRVEANMQLAQGLDLFGGYRNIETEYTNDIKQTFNKGFYGGMKFGF